MVLIGEDVSKRLDVTPAKFRLIVTKRHDICRNLIRVWVQKHQAGRDRQSQADSPARARTRPAATRGSIDVRLTLAALNAAVEMRKPPPGCAHHSDRGSQYVALTHRQTLLRHGFIGSMGRRDNPYDNAIAESFMKTMKVEAVYPMAYETLEDVVEDLPRFIDEMYNKRRFAFSSRLSHTQQFEDQYALQRVKSDA